MNDNITPQIIVNDSVLDSPFDFVIGEIGNATMNHNQKTISFAGEYENPVVLATSLTRNGHDPATVRFTDISESSFTAFIEEPNYLAPGKHSYESFSYVVIEAGTYELSDGALIEANTINSNATTRKNWQSIELENDFESKPIILSQVQTNRGEDFVRTRIRNVNGDGFEVAMEEEESNLYSGHATETIGFLAISKGSGTWGDSLYQAGHTRHVVTHSNHVLEFDDFDQAPNFMASVGSYSGSDSVGVRHHSLSADGVTLMLDEDSSKDKERLHTREVVNFLAIEGDGFLTGALTNFELPEIEVTTTNENNLLEPGTIASITWNKDFLEQGKFLNSTTYAEIGLYHDGDLIQKIDYRTDNDGQAYWTVPTNLPLSDRYKIRISEPDYGVVGSFLPAYIPIKDTSDRFAAEIGISLGDGFEYIFLDDDSTASAEEVHHTSKGERLHPGKIASITWNEDFFESDESFNFSGFNFFDSNISEQEVEIKLYHDEDLIHEIAAQTANDGQLYWSLPNDLPVGDRYRIEVSQYTYPVNTPVPLDDLTTQNIEISNVRAGVNVRFGRGVNNGFIDGNSGDRDIGLRNDFDDDDFDSNFSFTGDTFFDGSYYLAQNPDVAEAGVDPLQHYVEFGFLEGRNPNILFNTDYYLEQNPDVAAAGINPLQHYYEFGSFERRNPSVTFDSSYYAEQNPDVVEAGVNLLQHYSEFGRSEGRSPNRVFDSFNKSEVVFVASANLSDEQFQTFKDSTLANNEENEVAVAPAIPIVIYYIYGAIAITVVTPLLLESANNIQELIQESDIGVYTSTPPFVGPLLEDDIPGGFPTREGEAPLTTPPFDLGEATKIDKEIFPSGSQFLENILNGQFEFPDVEEGGSYFLASSPISGISDNEYTALIETGLSDSEISEQFDLLGDIYLFRGTSEGFPGNPALQRLGVSPASVDPFVATVFGVESKTKGGNGVVLYGSQEGFGNPTIGLGNTRRKLEREVSVDLTPTEFATAAPNSISVDRARQILQEIGFNIPLTLDSDAARDLLENTPRLSPKQIQEFITKAASSQ